MNFTNDATFRTRSCTPPLFRASSHDSTGFKRSLSLGSIISLDVPLSDDCRVEDLSLALEQMDQEEYHRLLAQSYGGQLAAARKGARMSERLFQGRFRKREIAAAVIAASTLGGAGTVACLKLAKAVRVASTIKGLSAAGAGASAALLKLRMQSKRFLSPLLFNGNGQIQAKYLCSLELAPAGGSRALRYAKNFTTEKETYSTFVVDNLEETCPEKIELFNARVQKEIYLIQNLSKFGITPEISRLVICRKDTKKHNIYEISVPKKGYEDLANAIIHYEHLVVGYVSEKFFTLKDRIESAQENPNFFAEKDPTHLIDERVKVLSFIEKGIEGFHRKFYPMNKGRADIHADFVLGRAPFENMVICPGEKEPDFKIIGIDGLGLKGEELSNVWEELVDLDQESWDRHSFYPRRAETQVKHDFMHWLKLEAIQSIKSHLESLKQMIMDLQSLESKVDEPLFKGALNRVIDFYEKLMGEENFTLCFHGEEESKGETETYNFRKILDDLKEQSRLMYCVSKGGVQEHVLPIKMQIDTYLKRLLAEEPLLETLERYIQTEKRNYKKYYADQIQQRDPFLQRLHQTSLQELYGIENHTLGVAMGISTDSVASVEPEIYGSLESTAGLIIGRGSSKTILQSPIFPNMCLVTPIIPNLQSIVSQFAWHCDQGLPISNFANWNQIPDFKKESCFHYELSVKYSQLVVGIYSLVFKSVPQSIPETRQKSLVYRAIFNDTTAKTILNPEAQFETTPLFTPKALQQLDSKGVVEVDESKLYFLMGMELERFDGHLGSLLVSKDLSFHLLSNIKAELKRLLEIVQTMPVHERPKDWGMGNILYRTELVSERSEAELAAAAPGNQLSLALTDLQPLCVEGEEDNPTIEIVESPDLAGSTISWKLTGEEYYDLSLAFTLKELIKKMFSDGKEPVDKDVEELRQVLSSALNPKVIQIDKQRGVSIQIGDETHQLYWDGEFRGFKISLHQESNYTISQLLKLTEQDSFLDSFLIRSIEFSGESKS